MVGMGYAVGADWLACVTASVTAEERKEVEEAIDEVTSETERGAAMMSRGESLLASNRTDYRSSSRGFLHKFSACLDR